MNSAPQLPWPVKWRNEIWFVMLISIAFAAGMPLSANIALCLLYTFMWVTERWASQHERELVIWTQRITWAQQFGCSPTDLQTPEAFKTQFEAWSKREQEARRGS